MSKSGIPVSAFVGSVVESVSRQRPAKQLRVISLVIWFIGALFTNSTVYFSGMILVTLSTIIIISEIIRDGFREKEKLGWLGLVTLLNALLDNWLYLHAFTRGEDIYELIGISVSIYLFSTYLTVGSLGLWLFTRNLGLDIPFSHLSPFQILLLVIQNLLRGAITYLVVDALFIKSELVLEYIYPILGIMLLEPLVSYTFYTTFPIIGTKIISVSDVKYPSSALRDSLLSNLIILWISEIFYPRIRAYTNGVSVIFFILLILAFWYDQQNIRSMIEDPLRSSPLGDYLNSIGSELQSQDFSTKIVDVLVEPFIYDLESGDVMEISSGSVIVPIKESGTNMQIMILGETREVGSDSSEFRTQSLDGISTTLVSLELFKELGQYGRKEVLRNIDLNSMGLPDFDTVHEYIITLGRLMDSWVSGLKRELSRIDFQSAGIQENKEFTKVNIPGLINVFENKGLNNSPAFTAVRLPFGKILDLQDKGTLVDLPGIKVLETSDMTVVDALGFIKVLETKGRGTLISIFGFTINDNMDEDLMNKILNGEFLHHLSRDNPFNEILDFRIGALLSDKSLNGIFSLSWDMEFRPLLSSRSMSVSSEHLLPSSHAVLLPESDDHGRYLGSDSKYHDD